MNSKDYVEMLNKYLEENPQHSNKEIVTSVGDLESVFPIDGSPMIAYIDGELCSRYGNDWWDCYDDVVEYGSGNAVEVVYV